MRGHEEPEKENGERWMLTYSDLITLLLALFIILFSMSNVDKEKYKAVIQSLGSVFGGGQSADGKGTGVGGSAELIYPVFSPGSTTPTSPLPSIDVSTSPQISPLVSSPPGNGGIGNAISLEEEKMDNVKRQVQGLLTKENLQNDVSVTVRQRGLEITINSSVLFNSGSADLTPGSTALVKKIANILTPLANNQITVEGHTDSDPIHTSQFPSNWVLSGCRASTVLEYLLASNPNLKRNNLMIMGYADTRPLAPNDTPAHKAMNRRVNIVILKDEYNKSIDIKPGD